MEKPKSYVTCPECGHEAHKLYNPQEIEEAYPNDIRMQVAMKREYQCSNKPCSHTWAISLSEVRKAFMTKRKEQGKTQKDVVNELTEFTKQQLDIKAIKEKLDNESKGIKDEN